MENSIFKLSNFCLELNKIIDAGKLIDIEVLHDKIRTNSLFKYLEKTFDNELKIIFTNEEKIEVANYFEKISISFNEQDKFQIKNNGLCLLLTYSILFMREIML
jgi:hypothetical protein